ncbi:DnaB-like helicase C-terminal domain-containing protein [Paenibacillus dokdonensis]|uniref:DNA 5'-3' helicase n=1 Tax=Paenibacillus dokdonensis TaxID=2567944 RepID=A0ABU6GIA0_9BACL|nr:DnaB-like helicase C-terminal domain-containing protein [Paenibacillus dokdonensis]MEC0239462.1 DnaB-like helicase C-terminal domain-containing protein [Paenibacillus dokdonensis]
MSLEAEQAALGALLRKPELKDDCYLSGQDFDPDGPNGLVMDALSWAHEQFADKPNPFDFVVLAEHWGSRLQKIGGVSYLMKLRDSVPSVTNFDHYQNIVRQAHIQRMSRIALAEAAAAGEVDIADTVDKLQKIADLHPEGQSAGPIKMSDVLQDHHREIRARGSRAGLTGVKTASVDLDQMGGGHQKGDVTIVAARPSIGKTAYIVNDSTEAGRSGSATVIFSAEMPSLDVSERFICSIGNIDSKKVRNGLLTENDWHSYSKALEILESLPIYIDDSPAMTIEYIRRQVKELRKKFQTLTVYIDYLQLIESERNFTKGNERVNYVSKQLKQIARTFNVPVIAISSVGRKCEERNDKRPLMSDLRESGNIEFDADVIIFLYRDDYYYPDTIRKGIIELIVAKGRKIGTGTLQMVFNRKTGRFINLTPDDKEKLAEKVREHERQGHSKR